jgi:hypothetical protein
MIQAVLILIAMDMAFGGWLPGKLIRYVNNVVLVLVR